MVRKLHGIIYKNYVLSKEYEEEKYNDYRTLVAVPRYGEYSGGNESTV